MKYNLVNLFVVLLIVSSSCQQKDQNQEYDGPGHYKIQNIKSTSVSIPFHMHNDKPLLELEINGEKANLMIDNGVLWDEVWLFGSPLVDKLNLHSEEEGSIGGAGEGDPTAAFFATEKLTLSFNSITFYEQPVIVSPSAAGFDRMFPGTDGQLCNTFFKHFIVEFDFVDNVVVLHKKNSFKPYADGCELELTLNESGTHAVDFSFVSSDNKVYTNQSDIDFGGVYAFKAALNNDLSIQPPDKSEPVRAYGAQGILLGYLGKITSMTFGKYRFNNPTIVFGDESTSRIHPGNLGVIGLPMFMKFDIAFDYLNNKIYFKPNQTFDGETIK